MELMRAFLVLKGGEVIVLIRGLIWSKLTLGEPIGVTLLFILLIKTLPPLLRAAFAVIAVLFTSKFKLFKVSTVRDARVTASGCTVCYCESLFTHEFTFSFL